MEEAVSLKILVTEIILDLFLKSLFGFRGIMIDFSLFRLHQEIKIDDLRKLQPLIFMK